MGAQDTRHFPNRVGVTVQPCVDGFDSSFSDRPTLSRTLNWNHAVGMSMEDQPAAIADERVHPHVTAQRPFCDRLQ